MVIFFHTFSVKQYLYQSSFRLIIQNVHILGVDYVLTEIHQECNDRNMPTINDVESCRGSLGTIMSQVQNASFFGITRDKFMPKGCYLIPLSRKVYFNTYPKSYSRGEWHKTRAICVESRGNFRIDHFGECLI